MKNFKQRQEQYSLKTNQISEPPVYDLNLEAEVLAVIIYFQKCQYKIIRLESKDFYSTPHQKIYDYCREIYTKGQEISYITFPLELKNLREYDEITAMFNYALSSLLDTNIKRLKEISGLRAIQDLCYKSVVMCKEDKPLKDIKNNIISAIDEIKQEDNSLSFIGSVDDEFSKYIEKEAITTPIKSGYSRLDSKIGGFYPGTFNVVASAQGIGKTTLVLNMVRNICQKQNKSVLFVSLEMSYVFLYTKLLSIITGFSFLDIITRKIADDDWTQIHSGRNEIYNYKLTFMGKEDTGIGQIREKLREQAGTIDLVCIDYLQLLKSELDINKPEHETIAAISKSLKRLAVEFEIPFIVISSINRLYADRKDFKPRITDLKASGQIEYDADLILLLHRPSVYRDATETENQDAFSHVAELAIAKNRLGASGLETEFYFDGTKSLFKETVKYGEY